MASVNTIEESERTNPISVDEVLKEQASDPFCKAKLHQVGDKGSSFEINRQGVLGRISPLDGTFQKVVPKSLQARILHAAHYPVLAGHPGATRMYYTLRKNYYWPHMAFDALSVAARCESCAQVRGTQFRHQRLLKLFPATGPLEFVAMDLLGPLSKTKNGNRFILVITDRFSKFTRSIPLRTTTAASVAKAFLDHWVYAYGAPQYLLTDNGPQFIAKFFDSVCGLLGIQHYLTAFYHPQTNGKAERFNKTILSRLRHYISEHQQDWDEYLQPLTYAYNSQVHRTTETTPFDLVVTRPPPDILVEPPQHLQLPTTDVTPAQAKRGILDRLRRTLATARTKLTSHQKRMKDNFDQKVRQQPTIRRGDRIFINRPTKQVIATDAEAELSDGISRKLLRLTTGIPYTVTDVRDKNVQVNHDGIPTWVSIDRVTVVPAHDPAASTPNTPHMEAPTLQPTGQQQPSGTTEVEYAIDRLVDHADIEGTPHYRVRWYGYTANNDTWEPADNLPNRMISLYHKRL